MLQRGVPFSGARQEDRDRLLRFDIHLNVAAVPGRVIRQPRMVVRGVQPHTLVVAGLPIENSLLPVRWPGERTHQQEREKERRSEEHTSELQSRLHLVCRLLLEKKNFCVMEAIKLCRLDTPIIFIEARINLSRFVVTGCAAKTSATVTFPSLNLISLFAFCFNIWLNGVAS